MFPYFANLSTVLRDVVTDSRDVSFTVGEIVNYAHAIKPTGRVFFIGNGGSAGIASHMAIDWLKNGGYTAMAFNDGASLTCLANDLGYPDVFAVPLDRHGRIHDLLFAISSSGQSENILKAANAGVRAGLHVVTLSGFREDNPLRKIGWRNFWVPSNSYGMVEISHLAILHAILDKAMGHA